MGWFGRPTSRKPLESLETVIGASASCQGTLRSDGGVRIDGAFEGLIEVAGNVVIGQAGRVVSDVTARNLTVGGALKGNVDLAGQLQILSTGHVFGDITVASVMIDEGGMFQGTSRMRGMEQAALPPPRDAAAATVVVERVDEAPGTVEGTVRPPAEALVSTPPDSTPSAVSAPKPAPPPEQPTSSRRVPEPTPEPARGTVDLEDMDLGLDLDRMGIEPVIPDMVIEDVGGQAPAPPATPTSSDRTGRRRRRSDGR
jgi:cytoskeletal protein CcmA (bactofilin family)